MAMGLAVEARAVGPAHPGRPQAHDQPPQGPPGPRVVEQADFAAGLQDPPELGERRLLLVGPEHAEDEARDHGVEARIGEGGPPHVHRRERDGAAEPVAPGAGLGQHRLREIDADHLCAVRVVGDVAARPDAGIQDAPAEPGEQLAPDRRVALALEGAVENVVPGRNPPVDRARVAAGAHGRACNGARADGSI